MILYEFFNAKMIKIKYKYQNHDKKIEIVELMIQFNSQADARPVSGRCNFDSFFRPLSLFRNSRPKMVVIRKYIFC